MPDTQEAIEANVHGLCLGSTVWGVVFTVSSQGCAVEG